MIERARIRLQAGREDGIALVMAVIVLGIITIAAGTAIFVTSGSQQDAYRKKETQNAYTLAQAAISNAVAELTAHYYDSSGQPFDNTTSLTDMAAWAPSGSQQSPTNSSSCVTTSPISSCMTWTGVLCTAPSASCPASQNVMPVVGSERAAWYVTGTGTTQNPSGTAPLVRTITVYVPVKQPPDKVGAPPILDTVYSGKPPSGGCDMNMNQQVQFSSPVYVVGNLCLKSGGSVESPTRLTVGGSLDNTGHGDVGTSSAPLPQLSVGGACNGSIATTPQCSAPWDSTNNYYSNSGQNIYASAFDNTPSFPDPPSVDFNWAKTSRGNWDCGGARDLTSNVVLADSTDYTCTTDTGTLSWNHTTQLLTINGNVYIDGNLTAQNVDIRYQGVGGIYVGGSVNLGSNTRICADNGAGSSTFAGGFDCVKQADWDTIDDFLMINSVGAFTAANFTFEGGLYSDSSISFTSGQTLMYGPIVTPDQIIPGQQAASGFPSNYSVFTGEPGTPTPFWTLGAPVNGTY